MESKEFEEHGAEMLHYVTSYLDSIGSRRALPDVQPGFMKGMIPDKAPDTPDSWEDVLKDVERVVMPGVSSFPLWQLSYLFHTSTIAMRLLLTRESFLKKIKLHLS